MPGTYDYGREVGDDPYMISAHQQQQQQPYGRASPMVSSLGAAPPAISNIRARAGDVGVSRGVAYQQQVKAPEPEEDLPKSKKESLLVKILTCRCG